MKIPNDIKKIICDHLMEQVIDWPCDEFTVPDTPENFEFAKAVYDDYEVYDDNKIYLSLYSVLNYWRDNE